MDKELFDQIERIKRTNPELFWSRVVSFPNRWHVWKAIQDGMKDGRTRTDLSEKLEYINECLDDHYTVRFG